MADIFTMCDTIERMADGFSQAVMEAVGDNAAMAENAVREQIYSGQKGDGKLITPSYEADPYFDEPGPWKGRAKAYRKWKNEITPPAPGVLLKLPPRPDDTPNLYINGKFHSEIFASKEENMLRIDVQPSGDGPAIVAKYGDDLLRLGPAAIGYINANYVEPAVWRFFAECGWS